MKIEDGLRWGNDNRLDGLDDQNAGEHLSAAQIDRLLFAAFRAHETDEMDEAIAQHLRRCTRCVDEMAELRGSVGLLREAVTEMSRPKAISRIRERQGTESRLQLRGIRTVPFAIAAALLLAAALIPRVPHWFPAHRDRAASVTDASPARTLAEDEALLLEIDNQLSTYVPTALKPLADPEQGAALPSKTHSNNTKKD